MIPINQKLKDLRIKLRNNSELISEDIFQRHAGGKSFPRDEICIFCSTKNDITKEHIIPKWVFEGCTKKELEISVNKQRQTFYKSVLPACLNCNRNLLSNLENYIIQILNKMNNSAEYDVLEVANIIRWLEIIDYKLQIHATRLRYNKHADSKYYDNDLSKLSVAAVGHNLFYTWRAFTHIKCSQRRIIRKSKDRNINSLVILDTKQASLKFLNRMNEYIFISFPQFKIALFYFLRKEFDDSSIAYKEAMQIIRSEYYN